MSLRHPVSLLQVSSIQILQVFRVVSSWHFHHVQRDEAREFLESQMQIGMFGRRLTCEKL